MEDSLIGAEALTSVLQEAERGIVCVMGYDIPNQTVIDIIANQKSRNDQVLVNASVQNIKKKMRKKNVWVLIEKNFTITTHMKNFLENDFKNKSTWCVVVRDSQSAPTSLNFQYAVFWERCAESLCHKLVSVASYFGRRFTSFELVERILTQQSEGGFSETKEDVRRARSWGIIKASENKRVVHNLILCKTSQAILIRRGRQQLNAVAPDAAEVDGIDVEKFYGPKGLQNGPGLRVAKPVAMTRRKPTVATGFDLRTKPYRKVLEKCKAQPLLRSHCLSAFPKELAKKVKAALEKSKPISEKNYTKLLRRASFPARPRISVSEEVEFFVPVWRHILSLKAIPEFPGLQEECREAIVAKAFKASPIFLKSDNPIMKRGRKEPRKERKEPRKERGEPNKELSSLPLEDVRTPDRRISHDQPPVVRKRFPNECAYTPEK